MASCRDIVDSLSALADGEMTLTTRLRVRAHLAMCANCRTYSEQLATVDALLHSLEPEPASFAPVLGLLMDEIRLSHAPPEGDVVEDDGAWGTLSVDVSEEPAPAPQPDLSPRAD